MVSRFYDNLNQPVSLGRRLGSGGEGDVFEVVNSPSLVAKVYHNPPSREKSDKLTAMASLKAPDLLRVAAWPSATLHNSPRGEVLGLLMPRVANYKEIHTLYSPAHRKRDFPRANWAFLVHAAMNCAITFDIMHKHGLVIGDVNESNVLASIKATVCLIDCDSFQVRANGRCHYCEVGVPQYTPPELQGKSFRGIERTQNHDLFGLAVLIFHLLFMGRHPFAGRFLGHGDMSLERAIKECRFAFSSKAASYQMQPPPHSLPTAAISSDLVDMFERAFGPNGKNSGLRPRAQDWASALLRFRDQLRKICPNDPGHNIPAQLASCPWCKLIGDGGPNFFIAVAIQKTRVGFAVSADFGKLWAEIEKIQPPGTRYVPTVLPPLPIAPRALPPDVPRFIPARVMVPRSLAHKLAYWQLGGGGLFLCLSLLISSVPLIVISVAVLLFFVPWWLFFEISHWNRIRLANYERDAAWNAQMSEKNARARRLDEAKDRRLRAEQNWRETAAHYFTVITNKKVQLQSVEAQVAGLKNEYETELRQLEKDKEKIQLDHYLQTKFIPSNTISKIGPSRVSTLRSNGIETAYDIVQWRIQEVDGIGPVFTSKLLAWRREVERGFRFDPKAGVPQQELQQLALKYKQREQTLGQQLRLGLKELVGMRDECESRLSQITKQIQQCQMQCHQAEADLSVVSNLGTEYYED